MSVYGLACVRTHTNTHTYTHTRTHNFLQTQFHQATLILCLIATNYLYLPTGNGISLWRVSFFIALWNGKPKQLKSSN